MNLKAWLSNDYDVVTALKGEISDMRGFHGTKKISEGLLKQIEERNVVFVRDGANIDDILNEGKASTVALGVEIAKSSERVSMETGIPKITKEIIWQTFPQ